MGNKRSTTATVQRETGAMRACPERVAGKRVGAVLTGGNTDLAWVRRPRDNGG